MDEQRLEKEEKLFRALSGVEEELLLRSEQSGSGSEEKVRKFPIGPIARIAAACLCFVVVGAMFVAVRDSAKWVGSSSSDMAAPQMEYMAAEAYDTGGAQAENEAAGRVADAEAEAEVTMPEAEVAQAEMAQAEIADSVGADVTAAMDGGLALEEARQEAADGEAAGVLEEAQQNAADNQLQGAVEGNTSQKQNDAQTSEDSAETMESSLESNSEDPASGESAEATEDVPVGKAGRHLQKKMTRKGQ